MSERDCYQFFIKNKGRNKEYILKENLLIAKNKNMFRISNFSFQIKKTQIKLNIQH